MKYKYKRGRWWAYHSELPLIAHGNSPANAKENMQKMLSQYDEAKSRG